VTIIVSANLTSPILCHCADARVSGQRHALLAAGDDDPGVARLDLLGASATARRPDPQTWLMPKAVALSGTPALMAAWRAGFCPCPAVSTWPRITSQTSPGATPARERAALTTAAPRSWAGTPPRAPLNIDGGARRGNDHDIGRHVDLLKIGRTR